MKRTKFVLLVAAMFAASAMLTSCWSHQDSPSSDVTDVETGVVLRTIVVHSNIGANVQIGSTTMTIPAEGGEASFENLTEAEYTVTATATAAGDFLPSKTQNVDVTFTEEKTSAVVTFNFVDATSQSAQPVAIPATGIIESAFLVQNDADAAVPDTKETIPATMSIPASIKLVDGNNNPVTGDQTFSLVAYSVAQAEEVDQEQVTPVIALECKPDGVHFENGVATLKAFIGTDAAGSKVVIDQDGQEAQECDVDGDGYVEFTVSHFSPHTVGVKTFSTKTTDIVTLVNESISFNAGDNFFPYERTFGWQSTVQAAGFFFKWHEIQFGIGKIEKKTVDAKFTVTDSGTGRINITQEVHHYTITSGNKTFNTTVYGAVTVTVTSDSGQGGSSHSGGSGN